MAYIRINDRVSFDTALNDAFGRLRVSNPHNVFSCQHQFSKMSHYWNEKVSGTASATHSPNEGAVNLSVGATTGDFIARQTRQYIRYQPGRSQLIFQTGVLGAPQTGIRRRVGYFDDKNGIYFELDGSNLAVVIRSYTSGSVVENRILQSDWNLDKMDGTGPSQIALDTSKAQIFLIDFEWLGVGIVRVGFVIDGKIYYCHKFNHANIVTTTYMTTANLPCRYEIENTGSTSGAELKQICTSVFSEGGFSEPGFVSSAGLTTTSKNVSTGSYIPIVSYRLKQAYSRAIFVPLSLNIINLSNSFASYQIVRNGTLTGASFSSASEAVEMDTSATSISYSTSDIMAQGFISNKTADTSIAYSNENSVLFTSDFDGNVTDILTIVAVGIAQSADILASLTWKEYR